jgi:glycosyltransferase involved in cell wall biosynthesis
MRIWLVKDMEPVPTDVGERRLMRSGMLCKALVERGHQVSWITSSFDHYRKQQRTTGDATHQVSDGYFVELLHAPGYPRNTSPLRVRHNRHFARSFLGFALRAQQRPDVIVTDIPTTETARAAIFVSLQWGIPSVLSIRDLWPDFFGDFLPPLTRPLFRMAASGFERQVTYACRHASAIIGISPRYLEWGLAKGGRERRSTDGVVPLGYEPVFMVENEEEEIAKTLRELGVETDKILVSFVGTWGATYDLGLMLDVASRFSHRSDIQFVLAGDGEYRNGLLDRIRSLPNVVAPGWLNSRQIALLLERSAFGLMPYRKAAPQGLPNKIFEYMAYGVFQISTLGGEAAELLENLDLGYTIPNNDPDAVADAMSHALEQGRHVGDEQERIRREFTSRYSADVIYADLSDRIEAIVQG